MNPTIHVACCSRTYREQDALSLLHVASVSCARDIHFNQVFRRSTILLVYDPHRSTDNTFIISFIPLWVLWLSRLQSQMDRSQSTTRSHRTLLNQILLFRRRRNEESNSRLIMPHKSTKGPKRFQSLAECDSFAHAFQHRYELSTVLSS